MEIEVETTEEGEVVGTNNDARLKILEQINDQNDNVLAEQGDLADVNDDGTTSAFAKPETLTDEEVTRRELDRAAEEANQTEEPIAEPEQPKHKIKVNGKELELTTEELIQRAQKVESADSYLKEASQKLRDAERPAVKPQPSVEDIAAQHEEEDRALARAIQMGTEEEAMAALKKVRGSNTPSVTADDVARTVDERLTFNDAVSRFRTDYKDLADDPVLLNIVLQRDKELIAQGDKRTYWERYEDIGNNVRTWKDGLTKPAIAEPEKPVSDKQTRKASAPVVPQGAGTKAPAAVQDEDKEETPAEVISKMAKSRGGPQWLRS